MEARYQPEGWTEHDERKGRQAAPLGYALQAEVPLDQQRDDAVGVDRRQLDPGVERYRRRRGQRSRSGDPGEETRRVGPVKEAQPVGAYRGIDGRVDVQGVGLQRAPDQVISVDVVGHAVERKRQPEPRCQPADEQRRHQAAVCPGLEVAVCR